MQAQEGLIKRVEVLDRGYVDLIAYMGNDLTIVNAARVSFGKHKTVWDDSDEKLLRYLVQHKHTSPFEHVTFQFRIKCPLFVRGQWHRHRTWSYNEISRRYTEVDLDYYVPSIFRCQSDNNRQASTDTVPSNNEDLKAIYVKQMEDSLALYRTLRTQGVCREQARGVLPQAFYTVYYGTVDLHNLLHFIGLRIKPEAQYEIQVYARALLELIEPVVPVTVKHFKEGLESKKS